MLKRHEDALTQRIEVVSWQRAAFVEWWELAAWYGQERISKGIWRDLRDRFRDAADDEAAELYVYEVSHGIMLLHSDALKKVLPDGSRQGCKLVPEGAGAE